MTKFIGIVLLVVLLSSCHNIGDAADALDRLSFEKIGRTVFLKPAEVAIKEIHLDNNLLLGQDVVVQGYVDEVGKFLTYIVVSESEKTTSQVAERSSRMLVILTEINGSERYLRRAPGDARLKIWGTIESGKKGLPYIQAKAIRTVAAKEPKAQGLAPAKELAIPGKS